VQGSGSATEVEQIGQHGEEIKPRKFHFRLMHKIDYRIPNDSLDKTDGDQHSRIDENRLVSEPSPNLDDCGLLRSVSSDLRQVAVMSLAKVGT
jgi:hypothetical protein